MDAPTRPALLLLVMLLSAPAAGKGKAAPRGVNDIPNHMKASDEMPLRQLDQGHAVLRPLADFVFPRFSDQTILSTEWPGTDDAFKKRCLYGFRLKYDKDVTYHLHYSNTSTDYDGLTEAKKKEHIEDRKRFTCAINLTGLVKGDSFQAFKAGDNLRFLIDRVNFPDDKTVEVTLVPPQKKEGTDYQQEDIPRIKSFSCTDPVSSVKTMTVGRFVSEFFPQPADGSGCPLEHPTLFDLWVPTNLVIDTSLP